MATLTATRRAYKDAGATTDSYCVRFVLTDGTTYRFTDAAADLVMTTYITAGGVSTPLGAPVTYNCLGGMRFSASGSTANESGTMDVEAILAATGITRAALMAGVFNKARVYAFLTNHLLPVEDEEKIITGYCGETTLIDGRYVLKFNSLLDALSVTVGKKYTKLCSRVFGSVECGIRITAPTWLASTAYTVFLAKDARVGSIVKPTVQNGFWYVCTTAGTSGGTEPVWPTTLAATIASGTATFTAVRANYLTTTVSSYNNTTRVLTVPITLTANHFLGGFVEFTSGNSQRVKKRITANTATTITLDLPLSILPSASDTIAITAGCAKRLAEDCRTRYNNTDNFGGFPYLPGNLNASYVGGTK